MRLFGGLGASGLALSRRRSRKISIIVWASSEHHAIGSSASAMPSDSTLRATKEQGMIGVKVVRKQYAVGHGGFHTVRIEIVQYADLEPIYPCKQLATIDATKDTILDFRYVFN